MGNLSVIGGKAKGFSLQSVPGSGTRPIMSKVKAALFNIVSPYLLGTSWMDLFAGTGSVGIEALSRGADFSRFVENQNPAVKTIRANLDHTGLSEQAEVWQRNVFSVLDDQADKTFDFIFIAPPQYKDIWSRSLSRLDQNPTWLNADSWVITQIDKVEYKSLEFKSLREFDRRNYGNTVLVFYLVKDGVINR
jgi:16S rRNA (guanine(966)-N(2))-methyltransferase RsmD